MNIGIVLRFASAEEGGVHTFEMSLVESVARLQHECRHKFHLVTGIRNITDTGVIYPLPRHDIGQHTGKASGLDFLWYLTPVAELQDYPYVVAPFDLQHRINPHFPEVSAGGEWKGREELFRNLLPRATRIFACNERGRQEMIDFYQVLPRSVSILPHPTPTDCLKPVSETLGEETRRKFGLPAGYLLYPAQFWAHKNHVLILRSIAWLKEQHGIGISVAFVGSDKGNLPYLKRVASRLGIEPLVYFPGFVSRSELIGLYKGALALSYTSYFGPENLPPLEAMALGCPVICTRFDGAVEQLGDAACLVDLADPSDLGNAVLRVKQDQAYRESLVAAGRKRATSWTSDDFARRAFRVFDELEPMRLCWDNSVWK